MLQPKMDMRNTAVQPLGAFLLVAAAACGGDDQKLQDITGVGAVQSTTQNLRATLKGSLRAGRALSTNGGGELPLVSETYDQAEAENQADSLVDTLLEHILDSTLIELEESTKVTFRLGEKTCQNDSGTADPDCVRILNEVPVRIELTSPSDGNINARVLIGADQKEVAVFRIYAQELAIELDLGNLKLALEELADAEGEETELIQLARARGRLSLALAKSDLDAYTFTTAVLQDIELAVAGDNSSEARLTVAAASPAWTITAEPNGQEVVTRANWGAWDLSVPRAMLEGDSACEVGQQCPEPSKGVFDLHLGQLVGELRVNESGRIQGDNVGFGNEAVTLKVDSQPLISLALNPNDGRKFSFVMESTTGDRLVLKPNPVLHLLGDFNGDNLEVNDPDDSVAEWIRNETLEVRLDGDTPEIEIGEFSSSPGSIKEQVAKVIAGKLTLTAKSQQDPITVDAGMCLFSLPDESTTEVHPFELFEANTCE